MLSITKPICLSFFKIQSEPLNFGWPVLGIFSNLVNSVVLCNLETSITVYRKRKRQRGLSVIRSQRRISVLSPQSGCLSAGPGSLFPTWHQRGSESQKLLRIIFQHTFFTFPPCSVLFQYAASLAGHRDRSVSSLYWALKFINYSPEQ